VRTDLSGKERGIAGSLREAVAADLGAEGDAGDAEAAGGIDPRRRDTDRAGRAAKNLNKPEGD
jgi:hypothetical protein